MRKDVRLGLAVGGILFGVVLVYTLFFAGERKTTGPGEAQQQEIAAAQNSQQNTDASGGVAAVAPPAETAPANSSASVAVTPGTDGNSGAPNLGADASAPPGAGIETAGSGQLATPDSGRIAAVSPPPSLNTPMTMQEWDWSKALTSGSPVPLVTETPGGGRDASSLRSNTAGTTTGTIDIIRSPGVEPDRIPAGQNDTAFPTSYIVKPGETFLDIASKVYGDGTYVSHLMRANPKIDPRKLRAGTTIHLHPREEVVPPGARAVLRNTTGAPANLDPTRQYRVRSGDSLSVISLKLYGNANRVEKLYQLNRDAIGPNPSALKLGMILQLPEPPTRTTTVAGTN